MKHATGNTVTGALEAVDGLSSEAGPGSWTLGRDHDSLMFTLFDDRHSGRRSLGLGSIHINLLLGALTSPLIAKLDLTLPLCIEETVPEDEEGLGEIGLDTPALVVNIVISSIVGGDMLQWIPGEGVSTVVIDGLDGREGEEQHALTVGHARNQESNACTCSIQEESLNWVIIESTESVGHIETVVAGVERHWGQVRNRVCLSISGIVWAYHRASGSDA